MILPGTHAFRLGLLRNLTSKASQVQPCGIDLTLRRVLRVKQSGIIDFDNSLRRSAETEELTFPSSSTDSDGFQSSMLSAKSHRCETFIADTITDGMSSLLHLPKGAYRVEFNETVKMPLDVMGQVFTRSSVWRSLAWVEAGVMDAGYEGAVGAALMVANEEGIWVSKNARLAQMVFHSMSEATKGYAGVYQGSKVV